MNGLRRNLLSNAMKCTEAGGMVNVHVLASATDRAIDFSDSRVGMDADQIDDLFNMDLKSERGTSVEKGTGLRMLLIKELVEFYTGRIDMESRKGVGNAFKIVLPAA